MGFLSRARVRFGFIFIFNALPMKLCCACVRPLRSLSHTLSQAMRKYENKYYTVQSTEYTQKQLDALHAASHEFNEYWEQPNNGSKAETFISFFRY